MDNVSLQVFQVTEGVYWVEVPSAGLRILCGCPAEVVKHLLHKGFIRTEQRGGITYETGPNAILLSDLPIQNGVLANMAEFPVLQMLYRQGMLLPNHPNNTGTKPLLLGSQEQLERQLSYIHRGNYGLLNKKEIMATGIDSDLAEQMMEIKLSFAFGTIHPPHDFIDTLVIESNVVTLPGGLELQRLGLNCFEFRQGQVTVEVNLNLPVNRGYVPPYSLHHHEVERSYFSVIHTGEGDGWDINRPSMSSVLMFQGRCYLVDAPPNIDQILTHLGIDLSEVDGLFHTHAHDDHFAGLTTLMRAGQRIKYYATALVRESVSKKLSALTGLESSQLAQFFDVHDLIFDSWNDCEGLEVMPLYSPHPVENNLLLFRTLGHEGYHSYAHWADLTSLPVLERITSTASGQTNISPSFIKKIKDNYLIPANIKKLDIGGGMIHGRAQDFTEDTSDHLILAHIARPLTNEEREIGSSATFGAEDILVSSEQDYYRQRAYRHLRIYFPRSPEYRIQALLNAPVIKANAGVIVFRRGEKLNRVHLLLSGSMEYIEAAAGIRRELSTGAFIGQKSLFQDSPTGGSYRTLSHVTLLHIPLILFRTFLESEGLVDLMRERIERIEFLLSCQLLSERISHTKLNQMLEQANIIVLSPGEIVPQPIPLSSIYLIKQGEVDLITKEGIAVERISSRDFFGEETYFPDAGHCLKAQAVDNVELLQILDYPLDLIPIVLWKLLEVTVRRRSFEVTL